MTNIYETRHLNLLSKRRCQVDIQFREISYGVPIGGSCRSKPTTKTVLHRVSGAFQHGKVNAIMGPSGSGKSSLLNALFGFNTIVDGQVVVNGVEYQAKEIMPVMRGISSYIMQEDTLIGELTVTETLFYAAKFKYGEEFVGRETAKVEKIIKVILAEIGMTESAKVRVAKLSGGERKRTAVAVELINYKPVLFLDECTTGLDSTSCYKVMRLLHKMARNGCNIIATVHQPNSLVYRLFDWLYVLAPGGIMAYEGHPMAITNALEVIEVVCRSNENPADVLFESEDSEDIEKADSNIKKLCRAWQSGQLRPDDYKDNFAKHLRHKFEKISRLEGDPYCTRSVKDDPSYNKSTCPYLKGENLVEFCQQCRHNSTRYQFKTLLTRSVFQTCRNLPLFLGRYIANIYVAMFFGLVFLLSGNEASLGYPNSAVIYLTSASAMACPAFFVVLRLSNVLEILIREHYINEWYSLEAFYGVYAIIEFLLGLSSTLLYTPILWLLTAQPHPQASLPASIIILIILNCTSYFLIFSMALLGDDHSNLQLPFLVSTIQYVFGGFLVPLNRLAPWFVWVAYANYGTWAYSGLMKALYTPWDGYFVEIPCKSGNPLRCDLWKTGPSILKWLRIEHDGTPLKEIGITSGFLVFFCIIGWISLVLKLKKANRIIARI